MNSLPRTLAAPLDLVELQSEQLQHDVRSHADILCLPIKDRITHMVLHFSKYVGRAFSLPPDAYVDESTLIDTFIIDLAAANCLGLNLSETTKPMGHAAELPLKSHEFGAALARVVGPLAKACEALDHVEQFDSRGYLEAGIAEICGLCRDVADGRDFSLTALTRQRWRQIDDKRRIGSKER